MFLGRPKGRGELEPLFVLTNVRKVYKMGEERIIALDDISVTFDKGRIYCLLGKSGSGKSTLLNMLAGLEKPSGGSIVFRGKPLEKLSEKQLALYRQKYIGFVFQSYNLLPTLTALENVTLPLIFRKIPKKVRNKRARSMLKDVGLTNRSKHKPSELSGGQQQRVSIARAFINDPSVIFADEPTGNLDTKTTFEMMDLITGIARKSEQTLVIVTHNTELSRYADQVIHIRDGLIEKIVDNNETPAEPDGNEADGDAADKNELDAVESEGNEADINKTGANETEGASDMNTNGGDV